MALSGEPDGPPGKCACLSLLDSAVSMLSYFAIWSLNRDWAPERVADSGHQTLVPAQNFRRCDGWIVIFCNKVHTISRIRAFIPPIRGLPRR
jgi:CoA-transferase family III